MAPLGSFSRQEVMDFLTFLYQCKMMPGDLDGIVEDLVYRLPHLRLDQIKGYADLMLPPGRMGHVKLVLHPPEWARGYALLVWLLRSIDRE